MNCVCLYMLGCSNNVQLALHCCEYITPAAGYHVHVSCTYSTLTFPVPKTTILKSKHVRNTNTALKRLKWSNNVFIHAIEDWCGMF